MPFSTVAATDAFKRSFTGPATAAIEAVESYQKSADLYAKLGLPCSIDGITAETYKRARDEIVVHRDGLLRAPLPANPSPNPSRNPSLNSNPNPTRSPTPSPNPNPNSDPNPHPHPNPQL